MKDKLVLTIDVGTQSTRAALVDKKGNVVGIVKRTYEITYYSDKPGYAEQDADYYFDQTYACLKKLCKENHDIINNVIGASITTFRDSSVQLDNMNRPVRRSIIWLDQRMAKAKEKIPFLHRIAFRLVHMQDTIALNRKRTIAHWLKENEPDIWSKTKKYVNISGYLTYRYTGNLCDSSASVTGHFPIDFKNRKWYPYKHMKARIFGIKPRMLCDLKQPGEVLGIISDNIADEVGLPRGVKLIATGSDKACETIGLGVLNRDMGAISYGTASTIEVSNEDYHEPETFLPAYPAACPNLYNMEVQVYRGYWMLTWFSKEFAGDLMDEAKTQRQAIEEVLNAKLSEVPPGCDGLVLQPYWGPGLSRPLAKGAIVGFSDVHTRIHLYRAVIEGIAYALREGLESIEFHQKHFVRKLMISGGGSKSEAICQITSDIFGLPVSKVQTHETTTLGCAICVFTALGEFKNIQEACQEMVHETLTFLPNEVAHQQYEYLYKNVYLRLYPRLKGIYRAIRSYGKRHYK